MTTSEQSKSAGRGDAGREVPTRSVPPEARVEKLGQLFNTLGRFFPVASAPEGRELFNKQEMIEEGNDEVRMANDEGRASFHFDIRNSNFVIPLGTASRRDSSASLIFDNLVVMEE